MAVSEVRRSRTWGVRPPERELMGPRRAPARSCNKLGAKMYPKGTNHFSPFSALFNDKQSEYARALPLPASLTCPRPAWQG